MTMPPRTTPPPIPLRPRAGRAHGAPDVATILRQAAMVLAACLGCGAMLWPIPYSEVSLPGNPSPSLLLLVGAVVGFVAAFLVRPGFVAAWLTVPLGFALAVIARVFVETARDPTSHNLWPFEVVIMGGLGCVAGLIGVSLARLLQRLTLSRAEG